MSDATGPEHSMRGVLQQNSSSRSPGRHCHCHCHCHGHGLCDHYAHHTMMASPDKQCSAGWQQAAQVAYRRLAWKIPKPVSQWPTDCCATKPLV